MMNHGIIDLTNKSWRYTMSEKHYVEVTKHEKVEFSKAFNRVLNIGILLTGLHLIFFVVFIFNLPRIISDPIMREHIGIIVIDAMYFFSVGICFISFIQIKRLKKPFSNSFSKYLIVIGYLWIILSFVIGHLPSYNDGFNILHFNNTTFIDGKTASIGIVIIVIGYLMKYGHQYQLNDDNTV